MNTEIEQGNKLIAKYVGDNPVESYTVGDEKTVTFSPLAIGTVWPPEQK
jgi:hypothetical protein